MEMVVAAAAAAIVAIAMAVVVLRSSFLSFIQGTDVLKENSGPRLTKIYEKKNEKITKTYINIRQWS